MHTWSATAQAHGESTKPRTNGGAGCMQLVLHPGLADQLLHVRNLLGVRGRCSADLITLRQDHFNPLRIEQYTRGLTDRSEAEICRAQCRRLQVLEILSRSHSAQCYLPV